MDIVSLDFIVFLIITIIAYFLLQKKSRWIVLLCSSLYFYHFAGKRALVTMVLISVFVFFVARNMEKLDENAKRRKLIASISIVVVVGWLVINKVAGAFNMDIYFLVFPLGISYISFSLVGYLLDVYWGNERADNSLLQFLLYVFFFPKIMQGPIVKHKDFALELYNGGDLSYKGITYGSQRMLYGYFKKMVVADRLVMFVDAVFSDISLCSGSIIVLAIIGAAFQLYCDFSGYMDIIVGFTEMLGLKLDENFRRPFFSRNSAEFWRRWHISLGAWFKDYVYTLVVMSKGVKQIGKLGRKKISKRFGNSVMKVIALSVVWIMTGLWHGTGINYLVWGLYWGVLIISSTIFDKEIKKLTSALHINTKTVSWRIFQSIRTFFLFCIGITITKMNSLHDIKLVFYQVLNSFGISDLLNGTVYEFDLDKVNFQIVIFSLVLIMIISLFQEKGSVRQKISEQNTMVRWFIYSVSIVFVLLIGIYGVGYETSDFAYTHF